MAELSNPNEHFGHLFLNTMKKRRQEDIFSIDAWTGEQATVGWVLTMTVRLSRALRRLGLQPGAPLALAGRNHNALRLPYYAALLNGLPVVGLDPLCNYDETKTVLKKTRPKIAFIQEECYEVYKRIADELGIEPKIVIFDAGEHSMSKFLDTYGDDAPIDDFQPAEFDVTKVYAWLISTSGTSGFPKVAAIEHSKILPRLKEFVAFRTYYGSSPKYVLKIGSPQWISSYTNSIAWPLVNCTILQTSRPGPFDSDHLTYIINKYRPSIFLGFVNVMSHVLISKEQCDLSCFDEIVVGGAYVYKKTLMELKARTPGKVVAGYGLTETAGPIAHSNGEDPLGCIGTPSHHFTLKLMDPTTGKEIKESYVNGELWIRGPLFKEYYNDPQETAKAFHEGWFKTGDLLYRDELNRYYYVERLNMVFKYKHYNIIPSELEDVLVTHPAVLHVKVIGIPHATDGQRALACIVTRPGACVTAKEIEDFIADALPEEKHLHGGVMFLDQLPIKSTGKVDQYKLKELFKKAQIE